jgi:hypothetical protein
MTTPTDEGMRRYPVTGGYINASFGVPTNRHEAANRLGRTHFNPCGRVVTGFFL